MTKTYGRGSIYQRKSDGLWVATVELPDNRGTNVRKRKTFAAKTRELAEARLAAYREENPALGQSVDSGGSRQANLARGKSLGTHTEREWYALVRSTGGICEYCGIQTHSIFKGGVYRSPRKQVKDHRTPLAAGGSDAIENIAVACYRCNALKGLMDEPTFRTWLAERPQA